MFCEKKFVSKKHLDEYLNFLEYNPFDDKHKKPLLIYIHGAGSRGDALSKMANVGPIKELNNGRDIDAIIIAPQCHRDTWFDLFSVLVEFIEDYKSRENVDESRVYIAGVSMGAYATWQMCISHPDWFAAAIPVCGGGMYWNAVRLKDLPIWAFHGALDKVVYPEESVKMVEAVNRNGGSAKLTIFPEDSHNSWDSTYQTEEMWEWLFNQKRG